MDKEQFYKELKTLGLLENALMTQRLEMYKEHIQKINRVLNLTAIDDDEGIYLKHFYDSLLINSELESGMSLCDIGSGAGFPGIVLAIARPDITMVCVEPTGKRSDFLQRVSTELKLLNVEVVNDRAEHIAINRRESFDCVTARAVAHLDILSELCIPLLKVDGIFIAMKGQRALEELEVSQIAINKLGAVLVKENYHNDAELGLRYNLEFIKNRKTPKQYPRSYAKIKKTPLSGRNNE